MYRDDWEWSSAYNVFYKRQLRRLMQADSYDQKRVEFLQKYKELLELQLEYIKK